MSWYKDEESLAHPQERYYMEPDRLVILDAQISDAGTYTCLGGRGAGLSVSVAAPINIEPLPEYQIAPVNTTVSILCNIDTYPQPKVSWYLGDALLAPSERLSLAPGKNGVVDSNLTIRDVSLSDRNRYAVQAESDGYFICLKVWYDCCALGTSNGVSVRRGLRYFVTHATMPPS